MFETVHPREEDGIILEPADAPAAAMGGPAGFHLLDTTMMFAPRSGGVKRYLLAKRDWLARRRPDIAHSVLVPGATTGPSAPGVISVAARRLPFSTGYRMPANPAKWEAMIQLLEPDLIEAGDIFVPGQAALEAGSRLGVPVVGFCHTDAAALAALHLGEWAEAPAMRRWASAFLRFDHVIAPSRHMARRLAEAGVERVSVRPLGVDLDCFSPKDADRAGLLERLELPAKSRLLVFAGRPAREKNIEAMICAVERLGDPYRLLLVGCGREARFSKRAIALDYERDAEALAGLLSSCDAFIHANPGEPFGLAVLEALACGLPVVGPRRGGVGELIDETVGQRVEDTDAAGLAEGIEALFARDLETISSAARRRAEMRHGWDTTFEGLLRIYGGLLGAGRPLAAGPLPV